MTVDFEPKKVRIRPLDWDTNVPAPSQDVWIEIRSADLDGGMPPRTWGFTQSAEILVPSLLDLPARTRGDFTELAIDLYAPFFPEHPNKNPRSKLRGIGVARQQTRSTQQAAGNMSRKRFNARPAETMDLGLWIGSPCCRYQCRVPGRADVI